MKLFTTVISLILITNLTFGQSDSLKIELSSANLHDVIYTLHNYYKVNFSYASDLLDSEFRVSAQFEGAPLEDVLEEVFSGSTIKYTLRDDVIILKKKAVKQQRIISAKIIDKETQLTIPYATVELKGRLVGAICDYKGDFEFRIPPEYENDSLLISSLGYERLVLVANDITDDTIALQPKDYLLKPFEVIKKEWKSEKLGTNAKKAKGELYMDTHGQQTALYFETEDREGKIEKIRYYLSDKGNTNAPFRVRIYGMDTTSSGPGEDILKEFLVVQPNVIGGWYEIDVLDYDLDLPEDGFFVAMEGVFPNDFEEAMKRKIEEGKTSKRKRIVMQQVLSYGQKLGFRKSKKYRTWHYSLSQTWFQLEQPFDVLIAVDILTEQ